MDGDQDYYYVTWDVTTHYTSHLVYAFFGCMLTRPTYYGRTESEKDLERYRFRVKQIKVPIRQKACDIDLHMDDQNLLEPIAVAS